MAHHPEGIDPARLSDDDLARVVSHLHATRHDTFLSGTEDALEHFATAVTLNTRLGAQH